MIEFHSRKEIYDWLPKGGIGAELGVCRGVNAVQMYHRAKPSKLHLVDMWVPRKPDARELLERDLQGGDHFQKIRTLFAGCDGVTVHKSDSVDWLKSHKNDYLDWLYLDTSHAYHQTRLELREALRVVKPNGLIMCHDYFVAVQRFGAGVIMAVNELANKGAVTFEGISREAWPTVALRAGEST